MLVFAVISPLHGLCSVLRVPKPHPRNFSLNVSYFSIMPGAFIDHFELFYFLRIMDYSNVVHSPVELIKLNYLVKFKNKWYR